MKMILRFIETMAINHLTKAADRLKEQKENLTHAHRQRERESDRMFDS